MEGFIKQSQCLESNRTENIFKKNNNNTFFGLNHKDRKQKTETEGLKQKGGGENHYYGGNRILFGAKKKKKVQM